MKSDFSDGNICIHGECAQLIAWYFKKWERERPCCEPLKARCKEGGFASSSPGNEKSPELSSGLLKLVAERGGFEPPIGY